MGSPMCGCQFQSYSIHTLILLQNLQLFSELRQEMKKAMDQLHKSGGYKMQIHQPLQDVLLAKEDLSPWEIQHHQPKCPKLVYRRENVKKTNFILNFVCIKT